jgi:hypothetical protein
MCGCEGGFMPIIIYIIGFFITWFTLSVMDQLNKRSWESGGDPVASWVMIICWPLMFMGIKPMFIYRFFNFFVKYLSKKTARFIQRFDR